MKRKKEITIINNIRKRRVLKGITQKEMSKAINISTEFYKAIENNKCYVKLVYLIRIADYFNVSVDQLIEERIKKSE